MDTEKIKKLTFEQRVQFNAINLRGAYLDMACDLEFLLVDIAVVCLVKNSVERKNVRDVFMEQNLMSKKISMAEFALEKYNATYYEKYKPNFAKFRELNGWRNKFAHSRIKGDPAGQDLSFIIFEYIKDGKMVEKLEVYQQFYDKLMDYAKYLDEMMTGLIPILYTERGL